MRYLIAGLLMVMITANALATPLGKPIRYVNTKEKIALLSFDDGPAEPYTDQILDILKKHDVKATFFVVGINVKRHPKIIKRIMDEGHDLGNHSLSHQKLKSMSKDSIKKDIQKTDSLIRSQGYTKVIPFRAPFGQLSNNLSLALEELEKPHILFNFLAKDWESPPPQVIHDRVLAKAKPGFIITLHDGWKQRKNTVLATEMIVKSLKADGYRFVTSTEFLNYD